MSNHTTALPLPVTVLVAPTGAVAVESSTRCVSMSRYSERATRLTLAFGPGTYVLRTDADVADLVADVVADLADALA